MEQNVIRDYLMGQLVEERQRQFETQFLSGSISVEELLAAEDELIDRYVAGYLSGPERERFEQHFLATPERRQKLNFAVALKRYISTSHFDPVSESSDGAPQPAILSWFRPSFFLQKPILSFSFATVLLLAFIGVVWFMVVKQGQPDWPRHDSAVIVTLTPGLVRGSGQIERISIPGNVGTVQIRLAMDTAEHQSYRVIIQTDEGRDIFSAEGLEPLITEKERVVIVSVPANILPEGDYQVRLSGLTVQRELKNISTYYFRVVK